MLLLLFFFFFQAADGIRDTSVTGVQTCALPIYGVARLQMARFHERVAYRIQPFPDHGPRETLVVMADLHRLLPRFRRQRSEERRVGKEGRYRKWREQ